MAVELHGCRRHGVVKVARGGEGVACRVGPAHKLEVGVGVGGEAHLGASLVVASATTEGAGPSGFGAGAEQVGGRLALGKCGERGTAGLVLEHGGDNYIVCGHGVVETG